MSMLLVSALGSAVLSGMSSGYLSLETALNTYLSQGGYPDAVITTDVIEREQTEALLAVPGIKAVDARLTGNVALLSPEGRHLTVSAISYNEAEIQQFYFWDQADTGDMDPILVEYNFAQGNGIHAGDTVVAKLNGENRQYAVAGIVSRPETFSMLPAEGISIGNSDFSYVYAPLSLLEKEVNPEYEEAVQTWEKRKGEFKSAQQEAQEARDQALGELGDAENELKEKTEEFKDFRDELEAQRAELQQKKDDLIRQRQEPEEKQAALKDSQLELNTQKKELADQQKELNEKREEAEEKQRELEEKRAEAEEKQKELEQQQKTLNDKRRELNESQHALLERRGELQEGFREALDQLLTLEKTRQQLLEGQKELDAARKQALLLREELLVSRAELTKKRAEVEEQLNLLRQAKSYLLRLNDAVGAVNEATGAKEQAEAALREIDAVLSDMETLQRELQQAKAALNTLDSAIFAAEEAGQETAELLSQRREIVDRLAIFGITEDGIGDALSQLNASIEEARVQRAGWMDQLAALEDPEELRENAEALRSELDALISGVTAGEKNETMLDSAIEQAVSGLNQLNNGLDRITDGLRQIKEGLNQADEKEAEIQQGLAQIDEGEPQLKDAMRQMEDGLRQMDDALRQMRAGRLEIAGYQAQIDDGKKQLNDAFGQIAEGQAQLDDGFAQLADYQAQIDGGLAEIADYQAQIDDGFAQIEDGFAQLADGLIQIDDVIAQIDEAVAEGEKQLREGNEQLTEKRTEAENAWLDFLVQSKDMEKELREAWSELSEWEGYDALCNQFLLYFTPDASPQDTLEAAKAVLGNEKVKKAVLFEDSPVKRRMDDNLIPLRTMTVVVSMAFFIVSMIVVYLFMSMLIRQCRREIGILRALGFSRGSVTLLFCGESFLISLVAAALGIGIGFGVRGFCCWFYFDKLFPLPIRVYAFDGKMALLSAGITILVLQISTLISTGFISCIQPSEAMSRPAPPSARIPKAASWLASHLSPFSKFSVLSLLRGKGRFLFSVVCVSCSVMLIFTAFSLIASTHEIMAQLFERRVHYDCQVFLSDAAGDDFAEGVKRLPFVSDVEHLDSYAADIAFQGRMETNVVSAVQENTALLSVQDADRRPIAIPKSGIVLEKHLLEKLGAAPGDTVLVNGVPMRITAVSDQCINRFQYVSRAQAEALGPCDLRSLIFHVRAEDEIALMEYLSGKDGLLYAVFTQSIFADCQRQLSGFDTCAWIVIGFAVLIGLVIVINVSQTNLLEQKRELCVLRTLGFQHGEISRHWFLQSLLYFLLSCLLGFPLGARLAMFAFKLLETESRAYPFVNSLAEYAFTAGVVFGFIVISHVLSMRSMKKWDLVESVKDKE